MLQTGGCVRCWDQDLPGILSAAGIEEKRNEEEQKNRGRKSQMMLAGLGLCMALGTPVRGMAVLRSVETAAERTATASDAVENIAVLAADEEIWGADVGDMSFLSGRTGDGTKEKPYQITTKEHLIGLAALASMGMEVGSGGHLSGKL